MRGLMLRIFFWFWLTLATMGVALILIWMIAERGPFINRARAVIKPVAAVQAKTTVDAFDRGGPTGLVAYLSEIERSTGMRAFMIDAGGREASQRQLSADWPNALALAERAARSGQAEFRMSFRETWVALPSNPTASAQRHRKHRPERRSLHVQRIDRRDCDAI